MVFLFLFVTCQITLMRWKTLLIQQKTTISVGLHLIFTTSNNLDGMENINSSIENNNTVNLDQHKSPFFGSLYFYPPPPKVWWPHLVLTCCGIPRASCVHRRHGPLFEWYWWSALHPSWTFWFWSLFCIDSYSPIDIKTLRKISIINTQLLYWFNLSFKLILQQPPVN